MININIEYDDKSYLKKKKEINFLLNNLLGKSLRDLYVSNENPENPRNNTDIYFEIKNKQFNDLWVKASPRENLEMGEFKMVNHLYDNLYEIFGDDLYADEEAEDERKYGVC